MSIVVWILMVWILLFLGGSLVPPLIGISVSCVPKENHSSASSLSQLSFNMLGYFVSPLFSAAVMDRFTDSKQGMIWGYRANLLVSVFVVIFTLLMVIIFPYFACKNEKILSNNIIDTSNNLKPSLE